ncbi:ImmA/IrrE family metallo-endopeptidase [Pseudochrobactrum asaccharolyticum]|uniref:ImmA/IrrE family metallo-endopeptidase n=1 Tax=Pseudochrobactrum asaccharolyticum TaxID=354351 RepID=UPI004041BDD6
MLNDETNVEIINRFQNSYPVRIRSMAEELGLEIHETNLPDNISGKIERGWSNDYIITVNSNHSENRKRFTIAHEIAHYILHRDLIGDGIIDNALYRDNRLGDTRERQANRYAATLLMPRPLVQKAWQEGVTSPELLAEHFQVSQAVADIRWRELGCILWA